jgi:hypothetical protein
MSVLGGAAVVDVVGAALVAVGGGESGGGAGSGGGDGIGGGCPIVSDAVWAIPAAGNMVSAVTIMKMELRIGGSFRGRLA